MYKTVAHTRSRTGRATTGRIRKRMKTRSLVTLLVTLLLIVLVGALAVNGLTVGKYIVKPQGAPTLVPETDPRKPYSDAAGDFKE